MQFSKKLKVPMVLSLLCLISIVVAACGGSATPPPSQAHAKAAQNRQVLVTGIEVGTASIPTLDPALAVDGFSIRPIDMMFTGLVQLDAHLNVADQLAASHKISADGKTYTFTLKPNLKFSDGNALTSTDVVYSINRALDPATKSPTGPYYLKYIKDSDALQAGKIKTLIGDSLLAPDPQTVVIITDKVYSFFLDALTYPSSYVVEKSMIDKYGPDWIDHLGDQGGQGTAGPFKLKQYTKGQEIDFVPDSAYYGPKPQLAEVRMPIYRDVSTAFKSYQSNQLDDDLQLLTSDFEQVKKSPEFHQIPQLSTYLYTMNYLKKPFDNIKIRQAFALAINKDLIAEQVWKGRYIATNHIIPKGMPGYYPDLIGPAGVKGTAGDPKLAKQLLEQGMQEEGYSSLAQLPPITLTFTDLGQVTIKNEVAILQQMWQQVLGINIKVDNISSTNMFEDLASGSANPLQLYYFTSWGADYPDPQDWTTLLFGKGAAYNSMSYGQNNSTNATEQQAAQQLMEQADSAPAGPERMAMYNRAEQQLVEDVAWIPIEQGTTVIVRKPCVQGLVDTPLGLYPPDDWSKIFISTDTPCVNATTA